jgi:hypothetical protein
MFRAAASLADSKNREYSLRFHRQSYPGDPAPLKDKKGKPYYSSVATALTTSVFPVPGDSKWRSYGE